MKGWYLEMTMGERIRQLRVEHNMSMRDLAKHLNVGKSAIHKYEKGEVENLPKATIEKMAVLFGVSPAYIMCFDQWDENSEALSDEVALIERIQAKWGKDTVELLDNFMQLNDEGRKSILNMIEDFAALPKYQK
jgi:transcriptional regulator with XRE-family HTH domain